MATYRMEEYLKELAAAGFKPLHVKASGVAMVNGPVRVSVLLNVKEHQIKNAIKKAQRLGLIPKEGSNA
jgi:hypothetical protein